MLQINKIFDHQWTNQHCNLVTCLIHSRDLFQFHSNRCVFIKLNPFKPEEINFDLHSLEILLMCSNSKVTSAIMEEPLLFLVAFHLEFFWWAVHLLQNWVVRIGLQTLTAPTKIDGLRIFQHSPNFYYCHYLWDGTCCPICPYTHNEHPSSFRFQQRLFSAFPFTSPVDYLSIATDSLAL